MNDYAAIPIRRDTLAALNRVRESSGGMVESYDHLIRRLLGLPERLSYTVDGTQVPLPP